MSKTRAQTDRVLSILRDAGGHWTSAQQITEMTGITRVAARIYDLKKQGIEVESKMFAKSAGSSYRLTAAERVKQPPAQPEAFPEGLFASDAPKPTNAIYGDEAA